MSSYLLAVAGMTASLASSQHLLKHNDECALNRWSHTHTHTHTHLTAPFPGLPGWASTRKIKPIWILLKQETVSGSGIS